MDTFTFQCFDLISFLVSNVKVSAGRWRCFVCEDFVSLDSLEQCGLTTDILKEFDGQADAMRNRIEITSDKSYQLLGSNLMRPARNRKRLAGEEGGCDPNDKMQQPSDTIDLL